MPSVQLDRSVQKRSDVLSASLEAGVEYGLLVASEHADENTFLCVMDALKVCTKDGSNVPQTLLSSAEVLSKTLCGGVTVVGFYAFVMTAGADSILSTLENTLGSLNTPGNKRLVITMTCNRSHCRILEGSGALQPGELKLVDLRNQYVAVASSVGLDLRFGSSHKSLRASTLRLSLKEMFRRFYDSEDSHRSTIAKVDGRVLPSDLADAVPIGQLPPQDEHMVTFFPESNVLVSDDLDGCVTATSVASVRGNFSCKAYVHESFSMAQSLQYLVDDLQASVALRLEQVENSKTSKENIYLPLRYHFSLSGTNLPDCFYSFSDELGDENGTDLTRITVGEIFNLEFSGVSAVEGRSDDAQNATRHNWPSLTTIVTCPGGPSMQAFNAGVCKDPVKAGVSVSSADQGDANTPFDGFETVSSEAQDNLSDSSPTAQHTETVGSGDTVEKTQKAGSSNIGFMLVAAGVAVALLAILLVVMRPAV